MFKEQIKKVRELLELNGISPKDLLAEEETNLMASGVLEGGQAIMTDSEEWGVGANVFIEEDGERIPLPDGDYKLEDGTPFVVEGGVVSAWGAAEEEAKEEEELSEENPVEDRIAALEEGVSALAEGMEKILSEFSKDSGVDTLKEQVENLSLELEKVKAEPVTKSVNDVQTVRLEKEYKDMTPKERRMFLISK